MSEAANIKYLLATQQDVAWGLTATTVGHQNIEPGVSYPVGDHPHSYLFSPGKGRILHDYHIVYITRGRGWFASAHQKRVEIKAGDMFFLFPGEWHNYAPDPETGWHESWIGFTGFDMDMRLKANFFSPEKPVLSVGILEEAIGYYKMAVEVAREEKTGYQQNLAGLINMLLSVAYSKDKQGAFEDRQLVDQINAAKEYMQENLATNLLLEKVAENVGLGYSKFRKVFREYTGFAPVQYLQELRTIKSKELLTNTSLSCQQIADMLGFESPSYFNVAFRKKTGMTPIDYRKITQGKNIHSIYIPAHEKEIE